MLEPWMVIALLAVAAISVAIGYSIGRSQNDGKEKLKQAEEELTQYKEQVAQHFGKTAELFDKLTHDYRDVYEHLAQSSENLCGDQVPRISADVPDGKLLASDHEVEPGTVDLQSKEPLEDSTGTAETAAHDSGEADQTAAENPATDASEANSYDTPASEPEADTPVTPPPAAEAVDADSMSEDDDSTGVSKLKRG